MTPSLPPWVTLAAEQLEQAPDHGLTPELWAQVLAGCDPGTYVAPDLLAVPTRDTLPGTPERVDVYAARVAAAGDGDAPSARALATFHPHDLSHDDLPRVRQEVRRGMNGAPIPGGYLAEAVPDPDEGEVADERRADLLFAPRRKGRGKRA